MKRLIIGVALLCSACSSPAAPSKPSPIPDPPMPAASLEAAGNLTTSNCARVGDGFACDFTGTAENMGTGCAQNVRGVTKTFQPRPFDAVIGSATFTISGMIRGGQRFTYQGAGVPVGTQDGWTYQTTFAWDNIRCP